MPIFISFNFSIPKSVPVRYFQSCKSEKALNEQRPEDSALKLKIAGFFASISFLTLTFVIKYCYHQYTVSNDDEK